MILGVNDIVPGALHHRIGWDMRHHFMAEKIVDRFGLQIPRDRGLVRQLAVIYVTQGLKAPPDLDGEVQFAVRPIEFHHPSAGEAQKRTAA